MAMVGQHLLEAAERFDQRRLLVPGELDQEQRRRRSLTCRSSVARKTGSCRARSIMVRSTNSTAEGPSSTMKRVMAIESWKRSKWQIAPTRCFGCGAASA